MHVTNAPHRCAAVDRLRTIAALLAVPLGLSSEGFAGGPADQSAQVVNAILPFVDNDSTLSSWGRTVVLDTHRAIVAHGCPPSPGADASCSFPGGGAEIWVIDTDPLGGHLCRREALLDLPAGITQLDEFGRPVDLHGDIAVVGAPLADAPGASGAGRVFVYRRTAEGTWPLVQTINAIEPYAFGRFGRGISLDGDRLVIGEPGARIGSSTPGVAWILTADENGFFGNATKVVVPGAANGDGWGMGVALVGDVLALSAPFRDVTVGSTVRVDAGAFASFDLTGAPLFEGIVTAGSEAASFAGLGTRLRGTRGSAGDILAVVAPNESDGPLTFAGAVRCYHREGASWTPIGRVKGTKSLERLDQVALSNDLVAIGSPRWTSGTAIGRTSLYGIRESGLVLLADRIGSAASMESDDTIGGSVAIAGDSAGGTWLYRSEETGFSSIDGGRIRPISFGDIAGDPDRNGVVNGVEVTVDGAADCDGNLVPDDDELASADCDANGELDACEALADSASSLPTSWSGASGWGLSSSAGDHTGILLARIEVPANSSGRLLSVGTRAFGYGNSALFDALLGVYRDPNGNKLPDDLELIEFATASLSQSTDEIRLTLSQPVDLAPGESIFVMLALKFASAGDGIYMLAHQSLYQAGLSFGGLVDEPDFGSLAGLTFPELASPGTFIGNLFATARFASLADVDADGAVDACHCLGDFDRSGAIDGADLALLIGAWGTPDADLTGDGTTDAFDLALLLAGWNGCG